MKVYTSAPTVSSQITTAISERANQEAVTRFLTAHAAGKKTTLRFDRGSVELVPSRQTASKAA